MDDKDFLLGQQIAKLQGIVEEGFKGVHARQDVTNGRIGKAEIRLQELEEKERFNAGEKAGNNYTKTQIFAFIAATGAIVGIITKLLGQ